jgi:hypothetical protein
MTAPACPVSALTVIFSGVDNVQGVFVISTSAVDVLLLSTSGIWGSTVVLAMSAVFEIIVPVATAPTS